MEAALHHQSQWPSQTSDDRERLAILEVSLGHMQRAADQQVAINREALDRVQALAHRQRNLDQIQAYQSHQLGKALAEIARLTKIADRLELLSSVASNSGAILRWGLTLLIGLALVTGRINGEQVDKLMSLFRLGG